MALRETPDLKVGGSTPFGLKVFYQQLLCMTILYFNYLMIAESHTNHRSPYSNVDVIILANRSIFARESESDWLFGLITIGNKPILLHLLQQLEANGLHNISLACLGKDKGAYSDFIAQNPSFHITLYDVDGTATTCNIIRRIANEKNYTFVFPN